MVRSHRDRLAAAEYDLAQHLQIERSAAPQCLFLSRFGFDFLEDPAAGDEWPTERLAGLGLADGPGRGFVSVRTVAGCRVLCHEWEDHPQEPLPAREEGMLLWIAARLGVRHAFHFGAALSLNPALPASCVTAISDHLRWDREDPLRGWASEREGARFPQMRDLYTRSLVERIRPWIAAQGEVATEAIALVRRGPCGATDAELRAFRILGADLVLEGGAAEAIAARHAGLGFLSLAVVLDRFDAESSEPPDPGTLAERAEQAMPALKQITECAVGETTRAAPPSPAPREEERS